MPVGQRQRSDPFLTRVARRVWLLLLVVGWGSWGTPSQSQRSMSSTEGPSTPSRVVRAVQVEQSATVTVDAGWFTRGLHPLELPALVDQCRIELGPLGGDCRPELFQLELPRRRIYLSAFRIDRFEVTRDAYAACVMAGACVPARTPTGDPQLGQPSMPVTGVDWNDATAYCAFVGGRLPTESEWERAARGTSGRRYPWGQQFNDRLANFGQGNEGDGVDGYRQLAPVGAFPDGQTPAGVHDMAGNVWEWTSDQLATEADWHQGLAVDPHTASSGETSGRILRGGSWLTTALQLRTTVRLPAPSVAFARDVGFRCAYDVPAT